MTSNIKQLDDEQKRLLNQFRETIKDCQLVDSSDEYLVKWLIARNYKVDLAEKMLRQSLEWRRLNRVNEILETWTVPEVIEKYYSIGQFGSDKFGCPLWVTAQGPIDIRGIIQSTKKNDLTRFMIYVMEKNALNMRLNRDRCLTQSICAVADMEHLSMWQMAYRPLGEIRTEMIKIYEANYPETLRRIFIINAPKLFTVIFSMMKPFMHQVTIDKVRVYGFNKDEWKAALLEEIDPHQLPAYYGGTLTDPDGNPKCPSKFNMGGEVPKSYYISNSKPVPKPGMQSIDIGSGSKKKLEFDICAINSVLRWEFMTEGGDIGFRVYHVPDETKEDVIEMVPESRIESHLVMEEGEIVCDYIGKYIVEFENSFSFFRSKKIHYLITVDSPVF